MTGLGRNRHLRFFESGRSNLKRRLPLRQTASGRIGRGPVIAAGDFDRPELAAQRPSCDGPNPTRTFAYGLAT
jgi:hypothetical protein